MPKLSPDVAASRRLNILDAARTCFARHGIHVSVDQICAEAGISKGAFYGYFKSKDAAIEAMAGEHAELIAGFADVTDLDAFAQRVFEYAHGGSGESSRLELEAWTHSLTQPQLRTILQTNIVALRRAFAGHLGNILSAGDADGAAEILSIFAAGLIVSTALDDGMNAAERGAALAKMLSLLTGATIAPPKPL